MGLWPLNLYVQKIGFCDPRLQVKVMSTSCIYCLSTMSHPAKFSGRRLQQNGLSIEICGVAKVRFSGPTLNSLYGPDESCCQLCQL